MAGHFRHISEFAEAELTTYLSHGATERIIYRDGEGGSYVRLLTMPHDFVTGDEPLCHDFDEVVYLLEGQWVDLESGRTFPVGTVALFPANTEHGPFSYPSGATFLEVRHYPRSS